MLLASSTLPSAVQPSLPILLLPMSSDCSVLLSSSALARAVLSSTPMLSRSMSSDRSVLLPSSTVMSLTKSGAPVPLLSPCCWTWRPCRRRPRSGRRAAGTATALECQHRSAGLLLARSRTRSLSGARAAATSVASCATVQKAVPTRPTSTPLPRSCHCVVLFLSPPPLIRKANSMT